MKHQRKILAWSAIGAAALLVGFALYPAWSQTRAPQILEPSGLTAAQFRTMGAKPTGEYDRPECGVYSLTLPDPQNYTQYEGFQLTAAAMVVAEIGAIQSGGCNCPYDRSMNVAAPKALLRALGSPEAKPSTNTRHELRRLADALQAERLQRCGL